MGGKLHLPSGREQMRFQFFVLAAALAGVFTAGAMAADHPTFAGIWIMDAQQSTGDVPSWSSMSVAQKGHWFRMAQNDKEGRAVRSFEGECKTDGRFHPVQGGNNGSISCKWDGTTLMTNEHWSTGTVLNERSVRTTMTADGKLVQEIETRGPEGPKSAHVVWKKQ